MKKKKFLTVVAALALASLACSTMTSLLHGKPIEAVATKIPCPADEEASGKITVRWFIGLGGGTDPDQVKAEQSVVDDFNASQDQIELVAEVVPYDSAKATLSARIAAGNGPDIIGPAGWMASNTFNGQWLDIAPLIECTNYDTSQFNPALVRMYETEAGQIGLPFAVYPSAFFYNTRLFDNVGLNYPPSKYGEQYRMPDGSLVDWSWDTVRTVARLLTIDSSGRNASKSDFNKNQIDQYGFTWQFEMHPNYWGSFWAGGSMMAADGRTAQAPEAWAAAWKWTYDGMWSTNPFMANAAIESSSEFSSGNPFNSGRIAMTDQPVWYTCCMGDVKTWDVAAMPTYNGKVGGRVDADTFRIWRGTKHPQAAFTAMAYLVGKGTQKLIIGTAYMQAAYGAVPARTEDQSAWMDAKKAQFPWVKNWNVVLDGLNYPDLPGAETYMPNFDKAWARGNAFASLLRSTSGLDLDREIQTYVSDLNAIFNM